MVTIVCSHPGSIDIVQKKNCLKACRSCLVYQCTQCHGTHFTESTATITELRLGKVLQEYKLHFFAYHKKQITLIKDHSSLVTQPL